jgi:cell division inhibitor SulA
MGQVLALDDLLLARQVWRGRNDALPLSKQSTGHAALDDALPLGGWPERSLTEILIPADGVGELDLLIPTLERLTQAGRAVALIAPPYIPYAPAWQVRGIDLRHLHIVQAEQRQAVWAFEQTLRSGACAAVVGWPQKIDHHALRRLQVAADTGQTLGFALRDVRHADNASPAALRLEIRVDRQVIVRKCRGGPAPARAFPIALRH